MIEVKGKEIYSWLRGLQESETQKEMASEAETYLKSLERGMRTLRKELKEERERSVRLQNILGEIDYAVTYFKNVFLPEYDKRRKEDDQ